MSKFKVGDKVYCPNRGYGKVHDILKEETNYPLEVWFKNGIRDCFTLDGKRWDENSESNYCEGSSHESEDLQLVENTCCDSGDCEKAEKEALEVMSEINAIYPRHYRIGNAPEAIKIMRELMTDEQLEGFLWGNILKYAYRYGRKGDKKETAGKIEWYAQKLGILNSKELKL